MFMLEDHDMVVREPNKDKDKGGVIELYDGKQMHKTAWSNGTD